MTSGVTVSHLENGGVEEDLEGLERWTLPNRDRPNACRGRFSGQRMRVTLGRSDAAVRTAGDHSRGRSSWLSELVRARTRKSGGLGPELRPPNLAGGSATGEPFEDNRGTEAEVMRHKRDPLCRLRRVLIARGQRF